jgi:murein DD-endopeptidase MepM/ murein hydrolase activator NlpD
MPRKTRTSSASPALPTEPLDPSSGTSRRVPRHAAPRSAARKPNRGPLLRSRLAGSYALIVAALIAVTCSVPATAVGLETAAVPEQFLDAHTTSAADAVQSLDVSAEAPALSPRGGYTVTAPPPPPPPAPVLRMAAAPTPSAAVQWPVPPSSRVSGGYGPRFAPCAGCSTFHKGSDLVPGLGTPIHSVADGIVTDASATDQSGFGVYAIVEHVIDGRTVSSVYAHMLPGSLLVDVGESVSVGQQLGKLGNTGQSTGPHLHFEILLDGTTPTDPLAWLRAHATV